MPYFELTGVPNVIADGHPRRSTILTLSHWPSSSTPQPLKRDLSAEIALAYLAAPELQVDAEVVSNNHFDIDGFMAVWALSNPAAALADPGLVAEVARAGDFGWTDDEHAGRIAFALGTLKEPMSSTLPPETFDPSEPHQVANLHRALLDRFGDLVADIDRRDDLWGAQVAAWQQSEAALAEGRITIEEHLELDLAVVTVDPSVPSGTFPYSIQYAGPCHPMAVHRATERSRILYLKGDWAGFVYRFESWVDYQSRSIPPRVPLAPLATALTDRETAGTRWSYAWPNSPNPPVAWLTTDDRQATSIAAADLTVAISDFLRDHEPADPDQSVATYS